MRRPSFASLAVATIALAGCAVAPAARVPPVWVPAPPHPVETIRRVCVQRGLGEPGLGGGSIVFETESGPGTIPIDTVRGRHLVAPSESALCRVPEQALRICPGDGPPVLVRDGIDDDARGVGTMAPGYPIGFYEYVSGGGPTKALVRFDGKARYVPADAICLPAGVPAESRATAYFRMDTSVPAGPHAFRPRSTAAIRRIVIHNTEIDLPQTLHHFGREDANTSAHVVIDRDGTIYRVVEDQFTAFHAGASKEALGGHNATSLGIEVVAWEEPPNPVKEEADGSVADFFSAAQKKAVIALVDFWMNEYHLEVAPEIMADTAARPGYADFEYAQAAVTIHRLTKADRGTNCPRLLFPDSPEGDERFFRWREATFSVEARRARAEHPAW